MVASFINTLKRAHWIFKFAIQSKCFHLDSVHLADATTQRSRCGLAMPM